MSFVDINKMKLEWRWNIQHNYEFILLFCGRTFRWQLWRCCKYTHWL